MLCNKSPFMINDNRNDITQTSYVTEVKFFTHKEQSVTFIHPHKSTKSLYWPSKAIQDSRYLQVFYQVAGYRRAHNYFLGEKQDKVKCLNMINNTGLRRSLNIEMFYEHFYNN
uniref:Uncharacterized protein n=1 Tax=Pectinophora gossypiella TaxID=13191 RepID=A0A1E1VXD4_PECGO